ncbi:hypothetical protein C8R43DRAFT_952306 [Mycena crocata]|nr:hypothetical protein C8R43DRAFT_952306 [Mycena crocata]
MPHVPSLVVGTVVILARRRRPRATRHAVAANVVLNADPTSAPSISNSYSTRSSSSPLIRRRRRQRPRPRRSLSVLAERLVEIYPTILELSPLSISYGHQRLTGAKSFKNQPPTPYLGSNIDSGLQIWMPRFNSEPLRREICFNFNIGLQISTLCFNFDRKFRSCVSVMTMCTARFSFEFHSIWVLQSFKPHSKIVGMLVDYPRGSVFGLYLVGGWDYSCMDPTSKANLTTAPLLTYNTETVVLDVEAIYLLASQFLTLNNETIVFDLRIQVACKNYGCIYNQPIRLGSMLDGCMVQRSNSQLNVSRIVDTLELRFNNGLISCCDRTRNVVWLTSDRGNYGFRAGSAGTMEVESECRIYGPWLQAVGIGIGISLVAIQPRFKTHIQFEPKPRYSRLVGTATLRFHVKSNSHTSTTLADFNHNPLNAIQPKLSSTGSRNPPELDSLQTIQLVHFNSDIISTPVGFYFIQDAARLLNLTSTTRGTQLNILTINYEYMQTRTTPGHRRCTRACMEAAHKVSLDHSSRSSSHIRNGFKTHLVSVEARRLSSQVPQNAPHRGDSARHKNLARSLARRLELAATASACTGSPKRERHVGGRAGVGVESGCGRTQVKTAVRGVKADAAAHDARDTNGCTGDVCGSGSGAGSASGAGRRGERHRRVEQVAVTRRAPPPAPTTTASSSIPTPSADISTGSQQPYTSWFSKRRDVPLPLLLAPIEPYPPLPRPRPPLPPPFPFPPLFPPRPWPLGANGGGDDSESKNDFCGLYAAPSFSFSFPRPCAVSSSSLGFVRSLPLVLAGRVTLAASAALSNFAFIARKVKSPQQEPLHWRPGARAHTSALGALATIARLGRAGVGDAEVTERALDGLEGRRSGVNRVGIRSDRSVTRRRGSALLLLLLDNLRLAPGGAEAAARFAGRTMAVRQARQVRAPASRPINGFDQ